MALSPIQIFQSNRNPLEEILSGGNRTISGILDQAVQIGRDMSNKQMQQEQDLIAMRQRETALQQRRAENTQQNNEDAFNFARRAFQFDRSAGQQDRALDLREQQMQGQLALGQGRLDLARQQAAADQARQDRLDAQSTNVNAFLDAKYPGSGQSAEQPPTDQPAPETVSPESLFGNLPATPQPETLSGVVSQQANPFLTGRGPAELPQENIGDIESDPNFVGPPSSAAVQPSFQTPPVSPLGGFQTQVGGAGPRATDAPAQPEVSLDSLVRREAELKNDLKLAKGRPDLQGRISQELASTALQIRQVEEDGEADTPAGRRSQERLDLAKANDVEERDQRRATILLKNTGAFVSPTVWGASILADPKDPRFADVTEAALNYDKDQLGSELSFALSYDNRKDYAKHKNMDLTPQQIKARGELWDIAHRQYGGSTGKGRSGGGGGAVSQIPGLGI